MNEYKIYFEFFGKRLTTTIYAPNEQTAKDEIVKRINFIKVENVSDSGFEYLKKMFGMN